MDHGEEAKVELEAAEQCTYPGDAYAHLARAQVQATLAVAAELRLVRGHLEGGAVAVAVEVEVEVGGSTAP